jgi:hypothetical protein
VEISESHEYRQEPVTLCRLRGEEAKGFSAMPSWMLDAARCAAMKEGEVPQVSWQALLELRRLIPQRAATSNGMVQHRHFPPLQGDADETVSATNTIAPTGSVPAGTAADDVGEVARGGSPKSQATLDSVAQSAPPSTRADRWQRGGAS